MPLAWIYFLLYSTIFTLLSILTQPAANLPRAANIVMSQSNAVSSSFPENLACLLMLQYQINFCFISLASFSPFSSDLLSEVISRKCFAVVEMMEKDCSRSPRKKTNWKSPALPCAEGQLWRWGKADKGCDPQAAQLCQPRLGSRAAPRHCPPAMAWRAALGPQGSLSSTRAAPIQLSVCPGRVDSWGRALAIPSASWSRPPMVGCPAPPASRAGRRAKPPSSPQTPEQGGQDLHQELLCTLIPTAGKNKTCSKLMYSNIVLNSSELKEETEAHMSHVCQNKAVLKGQWDDKTHHQERRC